MFLLSFIGKFVILVLSFCLIFQTLNLCIINHFSCHRDDNKILPAHSFVALFRVYCKCGRYSIHLLAYNDPEAWKFKPDIHDVILLSLLE